MQQGANANEPCCKRQRSMVWLVFSLVRNAWRVWRVGWITKVVHSKEQGLHAVRARSYGHKTMLFRRVPPVEHGTTSFGINADERLEIKSRASWYFCYLHHFRRNRLIDSELLQNKPTSNLHGTYMMTFSANISPWNWKRWRARVLFSLTIREKN